MRPSSLSAIPIGLVAVVVVACSSSSPTGTGGGGGGGNTTTSTYSAQLGSLAFVGNSDLFAYHLVAGNDSLVTITGGMTGSGTQVPLVFLSLTEFYGVGTYPLGSAHFGEPHAGTAKVEVQAPGDTTITYDQGSVGDAGSDGVVNVTSYDGHTIAGTFSFTAYSEGVGTLLTVTNGKFSMPFTACTGCSTRTVPLSRTGSAGTP